LFKLKQVDDFKLNILNEIVGQDLLGNLRKKTATERGALALHLPLRAQVLHQKHVTCLGVVYSIELFLIFVGLSCHLNEFSCLLAALFSLPSRKFLVYFRVPLQQKLFSLFHYFWYILDKGVLCEETLDVQSASRPAEQVVDKLWRKQFLDFPGLVEIIENLKSLTKSRFTSSACILLVFLRSPFSSKSL
jgi:hypothetical protein